MMDPLPNVVGQLIVAQNNFDSNLFSDCFSEDAIVFDEDNAYHGKPAIKEWIEGANDTYQTSMRPIEYSAETQRLKAEISGNFPGSPLVLNYQFKIKEDKIHSLKVV